MDRYLSDGPASVTEIYSRPVDPVAHQKIVAGGPALDDWGYAREYLAEPSGRPYSCLMGDLKFFEFWEDTGNGVYVLHLGS